jgi:hypothetical protein
MYSLAVLAFVSFLLALVLTPCAGTCSEVSESWITRMVSGRPTRRRSRE